MTLIERKPIFFHVYFHFENFWDAEVGMECIEKELKILQKYNVKGDTNFFDVMAEIIRDKNPNLLRLIQEADMPLGYHCHFLPNPRLARIVDKEWDEAVKMYTESEGWGVEVKHTRDERANALTSSKPGGLAAMQKIFGKTAITECPFSSNAPIAYALKNNFNIRSAVDGGSHFYMRAFPPRRPDRLWNYDEYLGRWTYLYWYMGLLFIKHPWHSTLKPRPEYVWKMKLQNLPPERWHLALCGSGDHPPSPREKYLKLFENRIKYIAKKFIPENPGSRFVTSEDLLEMVVTYGEKTLDKQKILEAAVYIAQNWVGRPPTYLVLEGDFLSIVDAFQILTKSLAHYHNDGVLPESAKINEEVLGPIGKLEEYNMLKKEKVISGDTITATAASLRIEDRIPYKICLESIGLEVNPAELLIAMALEYREIYKSGKTKPVGIDTAHIEPLNPTYEMVPLIPRVPYRETAKFSRIDWYTRLQNWTVKPAIIKPGHLARA